MDAGTPTAQVVESFADAPDPRGRQLLSDLVRHLHHFVTSNDVTQSEWEQAIDFLTRTGQISTSTRQEFVLLSDTLGVSSIVDLLTHSRTPQTTPSAVLGPLRWTDRRKPHRAATSAGVAGTPLWADILITDTDGRPVPDAVTDVWQANKDGFYDVQLPSWTARCCGAACAPTSRDACASGRPCRPSTRSRTTDRWDSCSRPSNVIPTVRPTCTS